LSIFHFTRYCREGLLDVVPRALVSFLFNRRKICFSDYIKCTNVPPTSPFGTKFCLFGGSGDGGGALHAGLALVCDAGQQLLDLGDGTAGVEALGTSLGAVHDGVTSVNTEGVSKFVESVSGVLISGVDDPSVSLHKDSGTKVSITIPPVAGTGGGAAGTQDALVQAVQLGSVVHALQDLLLTVGNLVLVVSLQPGLNAPVLFIEVVHVRDEILDNIHVRKRVDLGGLVVGLDLGQAGKGVHASNVHGARATDAFPAGPSEGQGGVHLVLDLDQSVQDHGTTVVQVNLVVLHLGLGPGVLGVIPVNCKGLFLF